jgi:hypothetical protein
LSILSNWKAIPYHPLVWYFFNIITLFIVIYS